MQDRRLPQAFGEQVVVATSGRGQWIPCSQHRRGPGPEHNIRCRSFTTWRKPVKCPTKLQSLMRSIVCWKTFDANGLGRVLLKGHAGSAAQTLVDPVWVGRGERTVAEKNSKHLHQSSGAGENDVRKIESSANAEPTAKAVFRRGLLVAWRACSVDPRSVTMITTRVSGRR